MVKSPHHLGMPGDLAASFKKGLRELVQVQSVLSLQRGQVLEQGKDATALGTAAWRP